MFLLLLLACTKAEPERPGTLFRDQVLEHDGLERRYHFYETHIEGERPLVLLLHGGGGTIDNHVGLGRVDWPHQVWFDIVDEEGLHLLVPQGVDEQWNDCRVECTRCGDADDIGFLEALLDDKEATGRVDRSRVYATGESNGGFMTQRLVAEAPERIAAGGVVIALRPENTECEDQEMAMPMLYQVGTTDAAIPYEGGSSDSNIVVLSAQDTAAHWAGVNGCEEQTRSTDFPDLDAEDQSTVREEVWTCSSAPLVVQHMEGAGHVAPSIEVEVSGFWEGIAGIQNHDIEGAREIWAFFEGQDRPR